MRRPLVRRTRGALVKALVEIVPVMIAIGTVLSVCLFLSPRVSP